jgi:hypothetical protein
VIRAAVTRDGTQLSWKEAAKQANDYLKAEAEKYYGKRKSLLGGAAPAPVAPKPVAAPVAPAAPVAKPAVTPTPSGNQRWNNDQHRANTKAAFRQALGKTE